MEFFKRSWTQVRASLDGMTRAERSLIVTLVLLGVIGIIALVYWAGRPETVSIGSLASGRSDQVIARLQAAGIDAQSEGGRIVVPVDQKEDAILLMIDGDLLGDDWSAAFDDIVRGSSPWDTKPVTDRKFLSAKQNFLRQIISKIKGVRDAAVVIDLPEDLGFGRNFNRPRASVTAWMQGGRTAKPIVRAIAALVSGAVTGMQLHDVQIIDGNSGRDLTLQDEQDILPTNEFEAMQILEQYYRDKIANSLNYIDNVIVAVNVRVDEIVKQVVDTWKYEDNELLEMERTTEETEKNLAKRGEPGPRSNNAMDISGGGQAGSERSRTDSETRYAHRPMRERVHKIVPGRTTRKINVTVNVPRGYFVRLYKNENPDTQDEPDDAALQPIISEQLKKIRAQIEPLIDAKEKGLVAAHMIPDLGLAQVVSAPGGLADVMQSSWMGPMGLGLVALISLALMLSMVRKATRPETLPTVEELAGVPPTLPTEDDLVGEVEEQETSLEGVEVNDTQVQGKRIAEQISDMIKASPSEAGSLLGKWVRPDD